MRGLLGQATSCCILRPRARLEQSSPHALMRFQAGWEWACVSSLSVQLVSSQRKQWHGTQTGWSTEQSQLRSWLQYLSGLPTNNSVALRGLARSRVKGWLGPRPMREAGELLDSPGCPPPSLLLPFKGTCRRCLLVLCYLLPY